ncbi:hypothetical protein LC612_35915 [Nostoc sp. CHAB 5834]|nr:hypothetical protein [Nostoc sp. CHAB 5834]
MNSHNLSITDTEYIQLLAQGYNPNLEYQLIELGESAEQARKLARVVGLTQNKPLHTEQEWQEFMDIWEDEFRDAITYIRKRIGDRLVKSSKYTPKRMFEKCEFRKNRWSSHNKMWQVINTIFESVDARMYRDSDYG